MKRYLLDTSSISNLIKGDARVLDRIRSFPNDNELLIFPIVIGEVLFGIAAMPLGRRRAELNRKAQTLLRAFRCEPVGRDASDHYAAIKSIVRRAGTPLDENDLWIAATASAVGAVLVSSDTDYNRIPNFTVEDWTR